ncbi:hypothetical protein PFNF135_03776 [Plasmodium falciparum NF135/5.C10]|uniref:Uncharacterized protein n=3 Tax=Plasmodium falciparum TaxID=5833 RepID=A0A024WMQ6_PLAFA|nr:hypothetical protein PFFVO_03235 [Plasmodium falciparum Vietnam Oak-Knoll (FVO)]ETW41848.1 hypothetical protein PFNF135_03776 [Plasmodium falciparum NF135/5.C10]ETW48437.1 hypothetical protein PFMALIP_03522 [Plasmodium falciparum MaliPS096_E11]
MMKLFNNFTCFLSQSIRSQEKNVEEYHMSTIDEEPINYKNKNFLKSSLSRHSLVILSIIYVLFHQNVFTSKWNEPSVLQLVNTHSRVLYDTEPLDENLNYESKKVEYKCSCNCSDCPCPIQNEDSEKEKTETQEEKESLNKLSTKNSTNDSIKTPKKKSNNKNTKENNKKAPQKKTNDKLRRAQ